MKNVRVLVVMLSVLVLVFVSCQNSQSPLESVQIKTNPIPDAKIQCGGEDGCSHGYWKNHPENWVSYTPETELGAVFHFTECTNYDYCQLQNDSFMDALNYGGGRGTLGAAKIMFKQAVSALLNAAHPDINYPNDEAWIITYVNYRIEWNSRDNMLWLAEVLDGWNNQYCPFDAEIDE